MHTAEKVETIVDCFLASRTTAGTFGTLVELEAGVYRVVADGLTIIVRGSPVGWSVSFKGFVAIDETLYVATANALDGGKRRDVSKLTPC